MHFLRKLAGGLAALLGLCLLAGCRGGDDSSIIMAAPPGTSSGPESRSEAPEAEAEEDAPEDAPMDLSIASRSISSGYAGNDAGCYTLNTYEDTSADIVYISYEGRTMDFLHDMPQAVTGLTGKLAGIHGSATPVWAGEHLFIFRQRGTTELVEAQGEAAYASVTRLAPDGTGAETCVLPESMGLQLSSAALWDGAALYFMVQDYAGDGHYALVRLDAATMTLEELHQYESGWEYSIEGYWSMGPVVQAAAALPPANDPEFNTAWDNRAYVVFRQGMFTGQRTDLLEWTQGLPTAVHANALYYWNADEGNLYAVEAETGEERVLAGGFAPRDYVLTQLPQSLYGGLVRIQFSANDGRVVTNFAVNPADGAVLPYEADSVGENVAVCAEGPGFFLVRNGEKWVRRELVEPGYDPAQDTVQSYDTRYVSMPEYAIITIDDYWAGRHNFAEIEDLVYGKGTRNSGGYTSYNAQQNAEGGEEASQTEESGGE